MPRVIAKSNQSFTLVLFTDENKKILKNKNPKNKRQEEARSRLIQESLPMLKKLSDKVQALAFFSKEVALEHSGYRRLELFFLTCCLVYDSKSHYEIYDTRSQGGSGLRFNEQVNKCKISFDTNACHSSIITNLKKCEIEKWDKQQARVPTVKNVALTINDWDTTFESTYLFSSVNATIELPKHINDFDRQIEGRNGSSTKKLLPSSRMRLRAIRIINRVASDKDYTPDMALFDYIKEMKVLYHFLYAYIDKKYKGNKKDLKLKIFTIQKEGFTEVSRKIGDKFFRLHLQLEMSKPVQKRLLADVPFSELSHLHKEGLYKTLQKQMKSYNS